MPHRDPDDEAIDYFFQLVDKMLDSRVEMMERIREHGWGFDLAAPGRLELLDSHPFVDFELRNLPAPIQRLIDQIPDDWQERSEFFAAAEAVNCAIEEYYRLPAKFYASLDDLRRVWIRERS